MEELFLLIFILINSVLINFGSLCLKKYANTHCNEDNEKDIKKTEKVLYYCGIGCCAILSFILLLFGPSSPIILKFGPIFITGISLICRLNKKKKIANIFCGIIIIPIITCVILVGIIGVIGFFQPFKTCEYEESSGLEMQMQIASFNGKFEQYEGTKRGAQVNSLLQVVIANNSNDLNEDRRVKVEISGNAGISLDSEYPTKIITPAKANLTYTVKPGYDNGLVNKVTITKL